MLTEFQKNIKWDALYITNSNVWVAYHKQAENRHSVIVIGPVNEAGEHDCTQLPIIADEQIAKKAAWDIFMQLP